MLKFNEIIKLLSNDKIAFKKHSVFRMHQRNIAVDEVKEALLKGEIIEEYPTDRPFPSALVLGFSGKKRPIHAVVSIDQKNEMIWVITVYIPSEKDWGKEYKIRGEKNEMPVMQRKHD